jgi:hypothetical protein
MALQVCFLSYLCNNRSNFDGEHLLFFIKFRTLRQFCLRRFHISGPGDFAKIYITGLSPDFVIVKPGDAVVKIHPATCIFIRA